MAVPGEDEYNLKHRYQSLKRRGETEWENFVDFFQWAKQSGYFKHAFLRRRDIGKKYSAENCYITRWKEAGCPNDNWPFNICCREVPNTEENLRASYKENQYFSGHSFVSFWLKTGSREIEN